MIEQSGRVAPSTLNRFQPTDFSGICWAFAKIQEYITFGPRLQQHITEKFVKCICNAASMYLKLDSSEIRHIKSLKIWDFEKIES